METATIEEAQKDFYKLINHEILENRPVEISAKEEKVVVVSKSQWDSLQEILYLQTTGVLSSISENKYEETEKKKSFVGIRYKNEVDYWRD